MKIFLGLLLNMVAAVSYTNAQITICEKNTIMYFSCYKLNPDSSFSYQYIDGTAEKTGVGTYSFRKKEIVFQYDSLISPIINKSNINLASKQINIQCADVLDSFPIVFTPVVYNKNVFFCDSSGQVRIPNYTDGPILVHNYVDSIQLFPTTDNCNNYQIYTHPPGNTFIPKGTVQVLQKKGKMYRRKITSFFDKKGIPHPGKSFWKYIYFNVNPL